MTQETSNQKYIYSFNYDLHHIELCKLESRQVFGKEHNNKVLFTDIEVDPSISPFIKNRLEILLSSENYAELILKIKKENIHFEGFKAEYMLLDGDETDYTERLDKLRDVGLCIEGDPDYINPTIVYSVGYHQNVWYFGILTKHNLEWKNHKQKPCSFSNSIGMNIAKTLVSMASQGNKAKTLLDACCGVGTVLLEACFSGFNIEGCDINWKACKHTRENLEHFNYTAKVYRSDIKDLDQKYDAAIIDLPYNLYAYSDDAITENIIASTAKLADRIVIVSITDIENIIKKYGLKVSDSCTVEKRGKSLFTRKIWVCEKEDRNVSI